MSAIPTPGFLLGMRHAREADHIAAALLLDAASGLLRATGV